MKNKTVETLHLELSRNEAFCLSLLLDPADKERMSDSGNVEKLYTELTEVLRKFDK